MNHDDDNRRIDLHTTDDESSTCSSNSSKPSWMFDDLEDPNDDKISVERDKKNMRGRCRCYLESN